MNHVQTPKHEFPVANRSTLHDSTMPSDMEHPRVESLPLYTPFVMERPPRYSLRDVERLRRFLKFCLAIDYNCLPFARNWISKEDFCHFAKLAHHCFSKHTLFTGKKLCYSGKVSWTNQVVVEELLEPAAVLRIPATAVISMLRIFTMSINESECGYHSNLGHICEEYGVRTIAAKLIMDRKILFPILLSGTADRGLWQLMLDANQRAEKRWFTRLQSVKIFSLSAQGCEREYDEILRSIDYDGMQRIMAKREIRTRQECRRANWLAKCYRASEKGECPSFGSKRRYESSVIRAKYLFQQDGCGVDQRELAWVSMSRRREWGWFLF